MFQLTPQRPAVLDGTSTFQLVVCHGAVPAGTRIRIHVETCSRGGEQVRNGERARKEGEEGGVIPVVCVVMCCGVAALERAQCSWFKPSMLYIHDEEICR